MLNLLTDKMYMGAIGVLLVALTGLGVKLVLMDATISDLEDDKVELTRDMQVQAGSLALANANEALLRMSIKSMNDRTASMQIDLDKAKKQYHVEEKRVYETIYSERIVLKDFNSSEDCNQTKRVVNEIINLW